MVLLKSLIVEDDPANLELMTEVFTSLQVEVRPLSDSEEAAALINRENFDGIFLDLEMQRSFASYRGHAILSVNVEMFPFGGSG
jgi:CheY-like chemotaxis protein